MKPSLGQNFWLGLGQLQAMPLAPHVRSTGRSPASRPIEEACDAGEITAWHMKTEELRRIFPTTRVFSGSDASLQLGLYAAPFLTVGVFLAISRCKYLFVVLSMFNIKRVILNSFHPFVVVESKCSMNHQQTRRVLRPELIICCRKPFRNLGTQMHLLPDPSPYVLIPRVPFYPRTLFLHFFQPSAQPFTLALPSLSKGLRCGCLSFWHPLRGPRGWLFLSCNL